MKTYTKRQIEFLIAIKDNSCFGMFCCLCPFIKECNKENKLEISEKTDSLLDWSRLKAKSILERIVMKS